MQKTLVDPYELRQDLFGDEVEVDVEVEEPAPSSGSRMLKILTPTKPIRPWLSEEQ